MGRKKTTAPQAEEKNNTQPDDTQPEGEEGAKKTRKPRAIDVEALRTTADSHDDTEAAQLLINRLDAYVEAKKGLDEAQAVLDAVAVKVRKAAALLD